jgi:GT2 family glycosyltransferase
MPKLSLVIPHWPLRPEHDELLNKCVKSIDADEKLIIVNEGTGMGKAINKGLELSTGDYIIVSNNDCELISGDIRDMCDPGFITLPFQMPGQLDLPRAFYCLPRWIYQRVGGYDERFGIGYFEDDDLIKRWQEAGIKFRQIQSINVSHNPGTTLNTLHNRTEVFEENKKKFQEKWHEDV